MPPVVDQAGNVGLSFAHANERLNDLGRLNGYVSALISVGNTDLMVFLLM